MLEDALQPPAKRVCAQVSAQSTPQMTAAAASSAASGGAPRACLHCVSCCADTYSSYPAAAAKRCQSSEWKEWWPAGLQSPTVYFYLRAKQLRYLFKHGHSDAAELWRPFSQCDYRAARLLRVRGRPPLAVHVPAAMTGISDASPGADSVRLLGHVVVAYPRPRPARVATTAAALAAAKLRSAAALAATRVPAPQRAGDRRPPLSPSASSGSLLSQASSGSLGSFSGSLRSLAPQGEGSPTPGASAGGGGHSGGGCNAAAPPAAHARPPLPRQAKFIVRELEAAPVQRFDTLRWQQQQQPLAAAAAAAAAAAQQQQQQQRRQSLLPGPGAGTVAAQAALSCQPWGPHAALAQHHVAVL